MYKSEPSSKVIDKIKKYQNYLNSSKKKNEVNELFFNLIRSSKLSECEKIINEVNLDSKDSKNYTVVHYAVTTGNYKIVELLLKYKPDIDTLTNLNQTSLIIACDKGYEDIANLLIKSQCNLNICDITNNTALHYASVHGTFKIILLQ